MLFKNVMLEKLPALKAILDLSEQAMLLFDSDSLLIECSRQAQSLFPEIKPGSTLADILGPLHRPLQEWIKLASLSHETDVIEFSGDLISLPNYSISWKSQAIYDQEKAFLGFCLVGTDYTLRDKLESELKISMRLAQEQKRALDEAAIVAITDQRGVIQYVNDTFCRISGYERSEFIGKTHALLKSDHHPPEFFHDLWKTIAKGKVWKGEIQNRRKDGEHYWVDTTIVPFLNSLGRPYQYIAIRNDITDKKLMQEKLEKEQLRALHAEKMASLGELASGIAHELGNPAASINAWLDVIDLQREREALDIEFFARMIPKVKRDAERIRDIIRGMLAYARDGSRDPFQQENPLLLINEIVESCNYKLRKHDVRIKVSVPNPYLSLECRSTEVAQTIINFILNACDAVQDLDERWIEISAVENAGMIDFRITDSGSGIAADAIKNIFNPFFTTKEMGKGTGLGLSIAKSIVENHQGTIVVDVTHPNTSFVISLPVKHDDQS